MGTTAPVIPINHHQLDSESHVDVGRTISLRLESLKINALMAIAEYRSYLEFVQHAASKGVLGGTLNHYVRFEIILE